MMDIYVIDGAISNGIFVLLFLVAAVYGLWTAFPRRKK